MKLYFLVEETPTEVDTNKFQEILNFIKNLFNNSFIKVLISTLIFILIWWLTNLILKKLRKKAMKTTKDKLLTSIIFTTILWGIRVLLIILYAGVVGIDTAGLAALVASAGVALGLALQGSLSNLAGGIVLLLTRPFQLGDYIVTCDVEGTVEDIKLFYTHLVTFDNKAIMIPNGTLANSKIINYSQKELLRVDLSFNISYNDDVNIVMEEIRTVYLNHKLVLTDPAPFIKLLKKENGVTTIVARAWVKNPDYWTVYYDLIKAVNDKFIELNVTIPNQQIDIYTK